MSVTAAQGRISHGHWKRSRESFDLLLDSTLTRTKADSSHNGKTENNETYVHSFILSFRLLRAAFIRQGLHPQIIVVVTRD